MRKWRVSRAFLLAVIMAAGTVLQDPSNPEGWSAAAGIIAAAVSAGARKREPQARERRTDY